MFSNREVGEMSLNGDWPIPLLNTYFYLGNAYFWTSTIVCIALHLNQGKSAITYVKPERLK